MTTSIADKLDEARALIEGGWVQKDYARDRAGVGIWPTEPGCVCFCALGAIMSVCGDDAELEELVKRPLVQVIMRPIMSWNDAPYRTRDEVIEAFRKAAELARQEQVA